MSADRTLAHLLGVMESEWSLFRTHRPSGAYLPVGQLDGDCIECHTDWPCLPVRLLFSDALGVEVTA